ncbi:hypothetical protein [Acinetobacter rathckeae]|uniref:hypothetical protein n=1 Tax=Acinetobacter rathckeae TaxID=2605272 RepID=UPI0018A2B502|nr:hypothetical protein [Acinetobacter rathckeae]MBF7687722.1 hypothetical protein [Acinetobacter rathckeae]MBF7688055.1 hypothetical protein [Acinetobacter rathckeae]
MNDNIIPYVPIADRVQATDEKSELLCCQFFNLIDHLVKSQMTFNHDTSKGFISIAPDQINDLVEQLPEVTEGKKFDLNILKPSLECLIYPRYIGEQTIVSPIWNGTSVTVWQFQLNQIVRDKTMKKNEDAELNLDQALSSLRIWRQSLEVSADNKDVTYQTTDLIYKLIDIEQKLISVQNSVEL